MTLIKLAAASVIALLTTQAALAQTLDVKRYNPSPWTKGRFSEVVTVTGPGSIRGKSIGTLCD